MKLHFNPKKIIALLLCAAFALTISAGCSSSDDNNGKGAGGFSVAGEWEGLDRYSQHSSYGFYYVMDFGEDNSGVFRYYDKQTEKSEKELEFKWSIEDGNILVLENFPCVSDEAYHLVPDQDITLRLELIDNLRTKSYYVTDSDYYPDRLKDIRYYNFKNDENVEFKKYSVDEFEAKKQDEQSSKAINGSWYITGNSLLLSYNTIFYGSKKVEVEANPIYAYRK